MLKKLEKLFFYLFIFSLPLQTRVILYKFGEGFNEWTSVYLYLTDIFLILVFLLWFWQNKNNYFFKNKIKLDYNFLLIIFLIFSFISIAWARNLHLSLYSFFKLLEFIGLFFYIKYNLFKFNFRRISYVFIFSGLVQSCIAIRQYAVQKSLGLKYLGESVLFTEHRGVANFISNGLKFIRPYGTLPHPNVLAAFILVSLFFLYYIWFSKGHSLIKKSLLLIFYYILLLCLFLTFSRAIIFIFLLINILYFAFNFYISLKNKNKALLRKTLFIFLLLIIFCFVFINLARPELFSRFNVSAKEEAVTMRIVYNDIAFLSIAEYPLTGLGIGNFVWEMRIMYDLMSNWFHQPVHNIYLLISSETGLISLIIFLLFIYFLIKNKFKFNLLFIFLLIAMLMIGLFDHFFWTLQQGQLMLWLVLGTIDSFIII